MEHRLEAVFAPSHDSSLTPVKALDRALALVRRRVGRERCERSLRSFASLGHHCLLIAAGLGAVFALALAIATGEPAWVGVTIGWPLLLLPLYFLAAKLGPASEGLVAASPCRISSLSFLDGFALLNVSLAVLALPGFAWLAVHADAIGFLWAGLGLSILCVHLAGIALYPVLAQVGVVPSTTASEEALGLLGFLCKGFLRLAPVAYGTAALLGTLQLLNACFLLVQGEVAPEVTLATAESAAGLLLAAAFLPLAAFLVFLGVSLPLQLVQRGLGDTRR